MQNTPDSTALYTDSLVGSKSRLCRGTQFGLPGQNGVSGNIVAGSGSLIMGAPSGPHGFPVLYLLLGIGPMCRRFYGDHITVVPPLATRRKYISMAFVHAHSGFEIHDSVDKLALWPRVTPPHAAFAGDRLHEGSNTSGISSSTLMIAFKTIGRNKRDMHRTRCVEAVPHIFSCPSWT